MVFYAESLDVVTSGHVTKMAVTPFDPQWPKTPCYTQLYHSLHGSAELLQGRRALSMEHPDF